MRAPAHDPGVPERLLRLLKMVGQETSGMLWAFNLLVQQRPWHLTLLCIVAAELLWVTGTVAGAAMIGLIAVFETWLSGACPAGLAPPRARQA